ncbi:hypothetical protein PV10_08700 [Exophiala mesophila]|uniref:Glutathione S-transferase n=1 Tax=Exophiala mesophila TaxID=212818 RepID=A0A0D1WJP9_EXOME|nr:uncharacterized protein PV10_08700 [Exophiala mesophila]KIV89095.1 hypothetical protein PV10_08700 [Exophiala mesophila]
MSTKPVTIHHLHISQSERIVFLAEELGLDYQLKLYTRAPVLSPPDLRALTHQGSAPVLTSTTPSGKEFNITESNAIAEYLLTVHNPSKKLTLPSDHEDYVQYLFWLHFANGTLQSAMGRKVAASMFDPTGSHPANASVAAGIDKALQNMNNRLTATKAYLAGDEFTAADVMTVWCVTNMRQWTPVDLRPYPAILDWLGRIEKREGYRRAMDKCEGQIDWRKSLTSEGPGLFPALVEIRKKAAQDAKRKSKV